MKPSKICNPLEIVSSIIAQYLKELRGLYNIVVSTNLLMSKNIPSEISDKDYIHAKAPCISLYSLHAPRSGQVFLIVL